MGSRKSASDGTPVPEVAVTVSGGLVIARVTVDGQPVDAEVRWNHREPWRPAPGGEASMQVRDARRYSLSGVRFAPPSGLAVTARVGGVESNTVEIEVRR